MASIEVDNRKHLFLNQLASLLRPLGFDVLHPFAAQSYNATPHGQANPLPTFNQTQTLGIVIANTKTFWSPFLAQYPTCSNQDSDATSTATVDVTDPDPIDHYCERHIPQVALQALEAAGLYTPSPSSSSPSTTTTATAFTIAFSHYKPSVPAPGTVPPGQPSTGFIPPPEKVLPFQRIAHSGGLAFFNPVAHLCVNRYYGPWVGLRALIVVDLKFEQGKDNQVLETLNWSKDSKPIPENPSWELLKNDQERQEREQEVQQEMDRLMTKGYEFRDWPEWVELRSKLAKDRGEEWEKWKYSNEQMTYHYTKDLDLLKECAKKEQESRRKRTD